MKKQSILSIAILVHMVSFSSCKKMNSCEKWEIRFDTYDKGCIYSTGYDFCNEGSTTYYLELCGDALKDARPGRVVRVGLDGTCCEKTQTYVRKL